MLPRGRIGAKGNSTLGESDGDAIVDNAQVTRPRRRRCFQRSSTTTSSVCLPNVSVKAFRIAMPIPMSETPEHILQDHVSRSHSFIRG